MLKEIVLAAFGATGFAILFGMPKKRVWIIFLTSGAAWYGYLQYCEIFRNAITALFAITILVVLFSKGITLFTKGPVLLYSTPILIPFIPGATLYYAMSDLVTKSSETNENIQLLIYQVSAMALGILVGELLILCGRSMYKGWRKWGDMVKWK